MGSTTIPAAHGPGRVRHRTTDTHANDPGMAYRRAVTTGLDEIVDQLRDALGASLVGVLAGVDRKTVQRWGSTRRPRQGTEERLRAAWQIYDVLDGVEDPQTIRQWFMGMNPDLDDVSPAETIAAGHHRAALAAARSFVTGA